MLTTSPMRTIAGAYRELPAERQALVYRIGLVIVVGVLAYVLVELAWQLIVNGGHCTGCNAAGDPAGVGGVTGGGSAGAAGSRDEPPGKSRFDDWLDDLIGPKSPAPSVKPVTPEDKAEAKRLLDLYQHGIGTKGIVEPEEGSPGDFLNKAMEAFTELDEILDFESDGAPDDLGTVEGVTDGDDR